MGLNLTQKLIKSHLVDGRMVPGEEIAIRIDQTLTQDSTGTMAYLQLEAMEIDRVKTKLSVAYVDHNMLQEGFENADDHLYIQTVASKYGIYFSRPGNGICHQVHLERFGVPGQTLLGSDSHTPTNGGLGMLAIGAAALTLPRQWLGSRITSPCRKWSKWSSEGNYLLLSRLKTLFWNCSAVSPSRVVWGRCLNTVVLHW